MGGTRIETEEKEQKTRQADYRREYREEKKDAVAKTKKDRTDDARKADTD